MTTKFEEVTIGECRLILGDCREVLQGLPKVDAVITDPPFFPPSYGTTGIDKPDSLADWLLPPSETNEKVECDVQG